MPETQGMIAGVMIGCGIIGVLDVVRGALDSSWLVLAVFFIGIGVVIYKQSEWLHRDW